MTRMSRAMTIVFQGAHARRFIDKGGRMWRSYSWLVGAALAVALLIPVAAMGQVAKYGEVTESGEYEAYIAQDGTEYKVGDVVKIGPAQGGNRTYTYVNQYLGFLTGSQPCPASLCVGREFKIDNFKAGGAGQNFRMWAMLKPSQGGFGGKVTVNFEAALASGELVGRGYTSDQALAELKRWKDKLDLGLVTPAEYEAKKTELAAYIR